MTTKEMIMATLEKMGLMPQMDDDGDISVRYQMKTIYAICRDEETSYLTLLLPGIHDVEEGNEALNLTVCNKMTRELKLVKVWIDEGFTAVSASCEFYYSDEGSLRLNLKHSLKLLGVVKREFHEVMRQLSEED